MTLVVCLIILLILLFLILVACQLKRIKEAVVGREIKIKDDVKEVTDDLKKTMSEGTAKLDNVVRQNEKETAHKFGEISTLIKTQGELLKTATTCFNNLNNALANPKVRGAWGEKMVEDIIRLLGLVEGINYVKQGTENIGTRPDYTFLMPSGIRLNLDSKFPLTNYLKYINAEAENEQKDYLKKFLKDVRERIKEVTVKDYINPYEGTCDFCIVFLPNDQILSFVTENDPGFVDYCLSEKVVLCSPFSLYIVLSVVRQASNLYKLEKNTARALKAIQGFKKEWANYRNEDGKVDKKITEISSVRDSVVGVRTRQLDKILNEIEGLAELDISGK